MVEEVFPGVFKIEVEGKEALGTRALVTNKVYGEKIVGGYRAWNPYRSKLAALILQGGTQFPFKKGSRVLYLGAGSGTTASHISDVVRDGVIYCVEFSARTMRNLILVCEKRKNMLPILADANCPQDYPKFVGEVDIVYQDVAQPNQAGIFVKNCEKFLKEGGIGILMVKTQSIDVTADPKKTVEEVVKRLPYKVLEQINLGSYQKEHTAIVISNQQA